MGKYCKICHKTLPKMDTICCTTCSPKYSSLRMLGRLPITKEESQDLKNCFAYDEINVLI